MEQAAPLDLTQQRSAVDLIGAAFRLYRRFPLLFWTLALSVVGPYDLIVVASTGRTPLLGGYSLLTTVLDYALVAPLISALHVQAVAQVGEGVRPRLAHIAARGVKVLPVVAATAIMSTLGIAAGFVLLIIPGIILALRWAVATQVAAMENTRWQAALKRSRELATDNYGHIFGLLLIIGLLTTAVGVGATAAAAGHSREVGVIIGGVLLDTILRSFAALATALLFFDLRARHAGPRRAPSSPHEIPRDYD